MSPINKTLFGKLPDGREVHEYTLRNKNLAEIKVINYGGIITSIKVQDKHGKLDDIVLGFDNLQDYLKNEPYFGAIIGRYGNRIANGRFSLEGKEYVLAQNNGHNSLHGGNKGFDKVCWDAEELTNGEDLALKLSYTSKDMEENFPGTLKVEVVYAWSDDNELKITYTATTDKTTIVNLTQHSYFNLSAEKGSDVLDHELTLHAERFLPIDVNLIPTGEFRNVTGTPFDFTKPASIAKHINDKDKQLEFGLGYDHCWVLDGKPGVLHLAASALEPVSGRVLKVFTTEPGIQFYSGNFLDGRLKGKAGIAYAKRSGFCLETMHYPDSPNKAHFPTVVLKPGETYSTQTVYKFSVSI